LLSQIETTSNYATAPGTFHLYVRHNRFLKLPSLAFGNSVIPIGECVFSSESSASITSASIDRILSCFIVSLEFARTCQAFAFRFSDFHPHRDFVAGRLGEALRPREREFMEARERNLCPVSRIYPDACIYRVVEHRSAARYTE